MKKNPEKSPKSNKKKKIIINILTIILVGIFLFVSASLVMNQIDIFNNKRDSDALIDEVIDNSTDEEGNIKSEDVKIDFEELLSQNKDTRGWIKFNGEYINYPIVQSKDNTYYLTHGFNKKTNSRGAIYMDFRNKPFSDENSVLYGHSTSDNTMFGSLEDVFLKNFFDEEDRDIIYVYDTDNNLMKYQIFSYYTIEAEDYYITPTFKTKKEYQKFINTISKRSFGKRDVEVTTDDKILTLSTCAGGAGTTNRRVIHAKRIE